MKKQQNNSTRAAALPITLLVASLFASATWLASAAVASPTFGSYRDKTLRLSTDATVTPDAAPTATPRRFSRGDACPNFSGAT